MNERLYSSVTKHKMKIQRQLRKREVLSPWEDFLTEKCATARVECWFCSAGHVLGPRSRVDKTTVLLGTKQSCCSPKTGCAAAGGSLPALPASHCTTPAPLSFPKLSSSRPPAATVRTKRPNSTYARDKDTGWDSPEDDGRSCTCWQVWRAFPPDQDHPRLLTCCCSCCCCSSALLCPSSRHNKSQASLSSAHEISSQVTKCPQTGWLVVPGCQAGKQGAREKGNLCARWPCVFNWLLGKAEKVMCTNQSRITDQWEATLTRSPPMRSRVCVSSSSPPGLDRGSGQRALFTKTKCGDGLVADGEQADILLQSQLATWTSSQTPRAPSAGPRWPWWWFSLFRVD